jgi:hypothetical protein
MEQYMSNTPISKAVSRLTLIAGAVLCSMSVQAGFVNFETHHADCDHATSFGFPEPQDFTTLGTAWDPDENTSRLYPYSGPGGATWSVMGAGISDAPWDDHGDAGPTFTTALGGLYAGGVDEGTTIGLALDVWASVSGFTNLGQVADGGGYFGAPDGGGGVGGDIRVGAIYIDGSSGENVLAHAYQPLTELLSGGVPGSIGGDVHFDNSNSWSDGGGGSTIDFFTVALHELGHSLGLGHSTVVGSVMEAIYAGSRRTLHADDIAGIQAIYGPVPGPATFVIFAIGIIGIFRFSR